ncbi:hypothetical protein ACIBFB_25625 [Nocardiopsis sp. NPDC050513]|uniref:hypothetical protein n=1 Tax=Nocardiopsis sp. NPDC050513 TaxID=3364338 RepID=UPI0037884D41
MRRNDIHHGDADRIELGPWQRSLLPRGLFRLVGIGGAAAVVLAGLLLFGLPPAQGWARAPVWTGVVLSGLTLLAACGGLVTAVAWLPRVRTRQGIEAGPSGLLLHQDARGRFPGRELLIPWPTLVGTGAPVNPRRWGGHGFVLHLSDVALGDRPPHWAHLVLAGSEPPEGEPAGDTARLFLQLPAERAEELSRMVRRWSGRVARTGSGVAVRGSVASTSPRGSAVAPPPASGAEERVAVGFAGTLASVVLGMSVPTAPAVILVSSLSANGWADPVTRVAAVATAVCAVVVAALAPWRLARQGVAVGPRGITVFRDRLLWARERRSHVLWEHVLAVVATPEGAGGGASALPSLQVYADRLPDRAGVRGLARVVAADEPALGTIADRPRLVIRLADVRDRSRIELLVRRVRPERSAADSPTALRLDPWFDLASRSARVGARVTSHGLVLARRTRSSSPFRESLVPWTDVREVRRTRVFSPHQSSPHTFELRRHVVDLIFDAERLPAVSVPGVSVRHDRAGGTARLRLRPDGTGQRLAMAIESARRRGRDAGRPRPVPGGCGHRGG